MVKSGGRKFVSPDLKDFVHVTQPTSMPKGGPTPKSPSSLPSFLPIAFSTSFPYMQIWPTIVSQCKTPKGKQLNMKITDLSNEHLGIFLLKNGIGIRSVIFYIDFLKSSLLTLKCRTVNKCKVCSILFSV